MEYRMFLEDFDNLVHVIKGECFGVALTKTDRNEGLSFHLLVHDDGNWFEARSGYSSYWVPDVKDVMEEASGWLEQNAVAINDKSGRYYRLKD